jgi:hypothetical protein
MSENEIVSQFPVQHEAGPFAMDVHCLVAVKAYDESDLIELGSHLYPMGSAIQWWYADWYLLLESKCGERAPKIARKLGFSPKTMENWATTARMFTPERRYSRLTYSHHRAVAMLPERERQRLLELADRQSMTVQSIGAHALSAKNQLEMISSGTLPIGDQREVDILPELDGEKEETESEAAEMRSRKYQEESDVESFAKAKLDTGIVSVSYAQIKALMEQLMDYAENDTAGKYLAVHSLKDALHQVQTAVRHGVPYGLCGSCGGTGADSTCEVCLGLGWLNKDRWRRQERQIKI